MSFKEFYNKLESNIYLGSTCYMDKECILDDCEDTLDNSWHNKTDSEKIDEFLETLEYWITHHVIKDIKNNINAWGGRIWKHKYALIETKLIL